MMGHKNALGHKVTNEAKLNMSHGRTKGSFKDGHTPWNKGKTNCYSKETLEKISVKMAIKMSGRKLSEETKQKMCKPKTEETKQRMRRPKNKTLLKLKQQQED